MTIAVSMSLQQWAEYVSRVAAEKGWQATTWENFVQKMAFAIGELDEGVDGGLGVGKDPLEVELADTAIRLLEALHNLFPNWSPGRVESRHPSQTPSRFQSIEQLLWKPLSKISKAIDCWRKGDRKDAQICVELALLEVFRVADALGIDLMQEIAKKTHVNEGPPPPHRLPRHVG